MLSEWSLTQAFSLKDFPARTGLDRSQQTVTVIVTFVSARRRQCRGLHGSNQVRTVSSAKVNEDYHPPPSGEIGKITTEGLC
jgi:hypothetical protein